MPVSLDRFSGIAAREGAPDSGIVRMDGRQDLGLGQSRFRLVRWVQNTGIGRRVQNRGTVNAFISSLRQHYGQQVSERMDFGPLRNLRDRGKPLHVRDIKAAISEADMVADDLKIVKRTYIEGLTVEKLSESPYVHLPGGKDLAVEVRGKVDATRVAKELLWNEAFMEVRGRLDSGYTELTAKKLVNGAVGDAQREIFLTGYGIETAQGLKYDRLQEVADRHPDVQALKNRYGLTFDVSRVSEALAGKITVKMTNELHDLMRNPGNFSGRGTVREQVERKMDEIAEQAIGKFIRERTEALEALYEMRARGEISLDDMGSHKAGKLCSLPDVVLHYRVPASMLSTLYELRVNTPHDLDDLASSEHTMEQKIGILNQLGEVMNTAYAETSEADRDTYAFGLDGVLSYWHDCGRFLLEGRFSEGDRLAIKDAFMADPPASDLPELIRGIADMRGGMSGYGVNSKHWVAAKEPLDGMSKATVALLGVDIPPLSGEYTPRAGNVLTALRNCGFEIPPPGKLGTEQSGKGKYSRSTLEIALKELQEDLGTPDADSPDYPGIPEAAVGDFHRASYVIDGEEIQHGDVGAVVEGLKIFCVDAEGNPDNRLLEMVGKLVYQRSSALAFSRFSFGRSDTDRDTFSLLKTAPFLGIPSFSAYSTYSLSRGVDNKVLLHIKSEGPVRHLQQDKGGYELDPEQSNLGFDVDVEIDVQNYTARILDMNYEYQFVPSPNASPNASPQKR